MIGKFKDTSTGEEHIVIDFKKLNEAKKKCEAQKGKDVCQRIYKDLGVDFQE